MNQAEQRKTKKKPDQIFNYLTKKFGLLLTTEQLGELLGNRSYHAMHSFLQSNSDEAKHLKKISIRIGRRLYWNASDISNFLQHQSDQVA